MFILAKINLTVEKNGAIYKPFQPLYWVSLKASSPQQQNNSLTLLNPRDAYQTEDFPVFLCF